MAPIRYVPARVPYTPGLFRRYLRTAPRLVAADPFTLGTVTFRTWTTAVAEELRQQLGNRNAFARHDWRRDAYASRAPLFADNTVMELVVPATDRVSEGEIRARVERAERLAFLLEATSVSRGQLHRRIGIQGPQAGTIDLLMDATLRRVSTRSRPTPRRVGVTLGAQTQRRAKRLGVAAASPGLLNQTSDTHRRVGRALAWLDESRSDLHPDSALVKTAIGYETLFGYDRREPLRSVIAERLAFLLGASAPERAGIARWFKTFYDQRSGIVHGAGEPGAELVLEVADKLLLLAAIAVAILGDTHQNADALRAHFEGLRWSLSITPPVLPFPRRAVAVLLSRARSSAKP